MPWIVAQAHDVSDAATASLVVDLPITPAVNDVIYICATNDGGGTAIAATGYTALGTQAASQGVRQAWLRKISDGTETQATITGTSDDWIYSIYILRGVDVSGTPEVVSTRQDWNAVRSQDSISFDATTAGNHSLLFYSWGHDTSTSTQYQWIEPSHLEVDSSIYNVGGINAIVGHRTLHTAGTAPTVTMWTGQNTDGGNGWVIAVKDANAATTAPYAQYRYAGPLTLLILGGQQDRYRRIDLSTTSTFTATGVASTDVFTATGWTPVDGTQVYPRSVTGGGTNVVNVAVRYIVRDSSGQTFKITNALAASGAYGTATDITADVTASTFLLTTGFTIERANTIAATIGGISTLDISSVFNTNTALSGVAGISYDTITNSTSTAGAWAGQTYVYSTPFNLSDSNSTFTIDWGTDGNWTSSRMLSQGAIIVFGDGTNWVAYQLAKKSGMLNSARKINYIKLGAATAFDSSGTIDWSNITRIAVLMHRGGSSTNTNSIYVRCLGMIANASVTGGCADNPANGYALKSAWGQFAFDHIGSNSGIAQNIDQFSYTIGDGTNPTYWNATTASQENPNTFTPGDRLRSAWNVNAAGTEIRVKACAACVIKFDSAILAGRNAQKFVIDAASSSSASYSFAGATFSSKTIVNDGDLNASNCVVTASPQVDGGAGTLTSVSFKNSTATTSALKLDAGGKALSCTFTKGAEAYAIQIDGNGPAAIDISGSTFSGYTKPLNLTGTTGTVTITLALGQSQPTYDTAGATVAWDQAVASTTWQNEDLVDGTSVLVVNLTTATTVDYEVVSGGNGYTITLVPGVDYTVGDEINVRQAYKNGTTYYQERTSRIITNGGGGTIIEADALEECPICTALGLDGEDYIGIFDLDSADDELDIVTAGTWQAGQLMTWWKYEMTLQAAMEEFWGAWSVQSDGSFQNANSILSSYVDTTETGDSVETTGRRIHRADGARPVRSPTTGGGSIDLSWRDPVTVVTTGGSSLTPAQDAALTKASKALQVGQFIALK
jgi:hypothetical protein